MTHVAYEEPQLTDITYDDDGFEVRHYDETREIMCGDWHGGYLVLCASCTVKAEEYYPQGWRYYPGDVCVHGKYTGGCGIDWMCGPCEDGWTHWYPYPLFDLVMTRTGLDRDISLGLQWTVGDDSDIAEGWHRIKEWAEEHPVDMGSILITAVKISDGYWYTPPEDT